MNLDEIEREQIKELVREEMRKIKKKKRKRKERKEREEMNLWSTISEGDWLWKS